MSDAKVITSLTNATVKLLASLRQEKFRQEHNLFLIEGARTLNDALRTGATPQILAYREDIGSQADVRALADACVQAGGRVIAVSEEILCKITQKENPQTVVAAYPITRRDFSAVEAQAGCVFIALDRIRDPGNLGTIIRTADAVGAAGVLLIGACCDAYAPECTRASTGSIFHVPIFAGTEQSFIELAVKWPGHVIGTDTAVSIDYRQTNYQKPSLIVMGTEQSGLSDAIAKACRLMVRIPMQGRAESLNVAVAASLMLYAVREGLAKN
jgi:RNA methyltransferase, TrmH family